MKKYKQMNSVDTNEIDLKKSKIKNKVTKTVGVTEVLPYLVERKKKQ